MPASADPRKMCLQKKYNVIDGCSSGPDNLLGVVNGFGTIFHNVQMSRFFLDPPLDGYIKIWMNSACRNFKCEILCQRASLELADNNELR